jgi:hypothetical protein
MNALAKRLARLEKSDRAPSRVLWIGSEDTGQIKRLSDGRIIAQDATGAIHYLPKAADESAAKWEGGL